MVIKLLGTTEQREKKAGSSGTQFMFLVIREQEIEKNTSTEQRYTRTILLATREDETFPPPPVIYKVITQKIISVTENRMPALILAIFFIISLKRFLRISNTVHCTILALDILIL